MKMKNQMKKTIARLKTHIRPEDEEETKEERNDEKDRYESFIEFRSR
jgi:ribosomal protein L29